MFKVTREPKFTHEVKVMVPTDGGHEQQTFKATFKVMPLDELADNNTNTDSGQRGVLKKVVTDMSDLIGEDDQALPYSDELRDRMIEVPYVRVALFQTYLAALTKAPAGN